MRTPRTLRLRRERLADLGRGELAGVAGASADPHVCYATREGGGCQWRPSFSPWQCLTLDRHCLTYQRCVTGSVAC